jgi:hypothetical protein
MVTTEERSIRFERFLNEAKESDLVVVTLRDEVLVSRETEGDRGLFVRDAYNFMGDPRKGTPEYDERNKFMARYLRACENGDVGSTAFDCTTMNGHPLRVEEDKVHKLEILRPVRKYTLHQP